MKLKHLIRPVFTIAALAAAFTLYGAWYAHVGQESALAVSLAAQIEEANQKSIKAEEAKQQLEKAASDEAAIKGYFVSTSDVVSFLESLQSTGASYGTKVEVVSVSSVPSKPHAQLQLSLSITGSFDAVERTLGAIEYQPYDTVVQNLTLDTPAQATGAAQWTAAATLLVGTSDATSTPPAPAPAPAALDASSTSSTSSPSSPIRP